MANNPIPQIGEKPYGTKLVAHLATSIDPATGELKDEAIAAPLAAAIAAEPTVVAAAEAAVTDVLLETPAWTATQTAIAPLVTPGADGEVFTVVAGAPGWVPPRVESPGTLSGNNAPYNITTSDTSNMQTWLDDLSTTGKTGVLEPGTYPLSDMAEVKSNTRLSLYGVTFTTSYAEDIPNWRRSALWLFDVENIVIEGLTINGLRDLYTGEHRHGIDMRGARHVTLRDIYSHNNRGDGVYQGPLGNFGSGTDADNFEASTKYVLMENVICDGNARQGMSITGAEHGRYYSCQFINTAGADPESGVDFERNTQHEYTRDHHFYNCVFSGNRGGGVLLSGHATNQDRFDNITFTNCLIADNYYVGVQFNRGNNFRFTNCDVIGTLAYYYDGTSMGRGYFMYNTVLGLVIEGGSIRDSYDVGYTSRGGLGTTGSGANPVFRGVRVLDNGSYGLDFSIEEGPLADGCTFAGNGSAPIIVRSGVTKAVIRQNAFDTNPTLNPAWTPDLIAYENDGYKTRGQGIASVANSGTIAHGLARAPMFYAATPTVAGRRIAITAANATNLTISLTDDAGAAVTTPENVAWSAGVW